VAFLDWRVIVDLFPIGAFPGIYVLFCNNKRYIGSSININKRVTEHKRKLKEGTHHSYLLQAEYNNTPEVTAYCIHKCLNGEELFKVEQMYLDTEKPELNVSVTALNNTPTKEYSNLKQGGERNHSAIISLEEAISIVRERLLGSTLKQIASKLNLSYNIVVSICSGNNWQTELENTIPEEYGEMRKNKQVLGILNRSSHKPSNRLFSDKDLLDILNKLLNKHTLQSIADTYFTSKAVISSIKRYKTYKEDIKRILTEEQFNEFISRIT